MIKYYPDIGQGSDEWFALRCGLLTASEMKLILTAKTLKYSESDKERTHLYELAAQRVTQYVEPQYITSDMLRGQDDEIYARQEYIEHYGEVKEMGFITNDKWGFTLGCSPDGLVGDDGMIECKSRRQKYQIETIATNKMPDDYMIQVQTELLVTERDWCDFISYCGGMNMITIRVFPDSEIQDAILAAAIIFHTNLHKIMENYNKVLEDESVRLIPTERRIEQEITI